MIQMNPEDLLGQVADALVVNQTVMAHWLIRHHKMDPAAYWLMIDGYCEDCDPPPLTEMVLRRMQNYLQVEIQGRKPPEKPEEPK